MATSWSGGSDAIPDLVIPAAAQNSNELMADYAYGDAICVAIGSPVVLTETVKIQVSFDKGATWLDLEAGDGSGLQSLPAAGQARVYYDIPTFPMMRLRATTVTAAERRFKTTKLYQA